VALEKPYSIGFFASQLSLAEREGLWTNDRAFSKNTVKQGISQKAGEGLRPPLCTTFFRLQGHVFQPNSGRGGAGDWLLKLGILKNPDVRSRFDKFAVQIDAMSVEATAKLSPPSAFVGAK
jgi:hypothetical protein